MAQQLVTWMRTHGPVAVAFSGGVDSAVVAKAAASAWPDQAVAITGVSSSLAAVERETARLEAARIGIRHLELSTSEFDRVEYRRNAGDRCYYCKDSLYTLAESTLRNLQVVCLVNGANADDLKDHRPGMKAAGDHHVRSPLIELGLTKADVRSLARFWNLSVAEKPASPCLASRIAYGVEVTEERVRMVEMAEAFLRRRTEISEFRVRVDAGEVARIEVPPDDLPVIAAAPLREELIREFRRLGFRAVTLDLEGFRSGSLNAALPLIQLARFPAPSGHPASSP